MIAFHEDTQAMQALAMSLLQQAPDGILAANHDGRIALVNTRIEEMFGYCRDEMLNQEVELLLPERFHKKHVEDRRTYAASPYVRQMSDGRLLFGRHKNGSEFPVQISLSPVTTTNDAIIVCFIRDVSRIWQIEKRLSQVQRMEAIGHLAGGIAHDFNNLLTIINGHAEGLFSGLRADLRACQRIQEIAKAGEKAAKLTRQLLAFSRQQILRPRVLNLNDLVIDFQRMLGRLIGEHIALTVKLNPDLRYVKVDPTQIEQVLMNLAVNARDAMGKGGRLTIETANVELGEHFAQIHPEVKPGLYVVISMSDNGSGMEPETLAHIFEPFFTTKEAGKGTGLGLATVYGIVKQSGGYVYAESTPGAGSTFKIYLPTTSDAPSGSLPKPEEKAPTGDEHILLVEDEEGVRLLLRSTLEDHGYSVIDAANGIEALALARTCRRRIDLLLTDVVMPEMGGRVLAEQFALLCPTAKLIFMSGYTDDMVVRHGVCESEVEFLQKPYAMNTLLAKIREVLDRGKAKNGPSRAPAGAAACKGDRCVCDRNR